MNAEEAINILIKQDKLDTNIISDGYHTFGELYEHRIELFIALCKLIQENRQIRLYGTNPIWKSLYHSDGTCFEGWFVLGIYNEKGKQISYHLPVSRWIDCSFAESIEKAPEFDGHNSADVLQRLKKL